MDKMVKFINTIRVKYTNAFLCWVFIKFFMELFPDGIGYAVRGKRMEIHVGIHEAGADDMPDRVDAAREDRGDAALGRAVRRAEGVLHIDGP